MYKKLLYKKLNEEAVSSRLRKAVGDNHYGFYVFQV